MCVFVLSSFATRMSPFSQMLAFHKFVCVKHDTRSHHLLCTNKQHNNIQPTSRLPVAPTERVCVRVRRMCARRFIVESISGLSHPLEQYSLYLQFTDIISKLIISNLVNLNTIHSNSMGILLNCNERNSLKRYTN